MPPFPRETAPESKIPSQFKVKKTKRPAFLDQKIEELRDEPQI